MDTTSERQWTNIRVYNSSERAYFNFQDQDNIKIQLINTNFDEVETFEVNYKTSETEFDIHTILTAKKTPYNSTYSSLLLNFLSEIHAYLLTSLFNGKNENEKYSFINYFYTVFSAFKSTIHYQRHIC